MPERVRLLSTQRAASIAIARIIVTTTSEDPAMGHSRNPIVALMLPYVLWISATWTAHFVVRHLLGLPWGI